MSADGLTYLYYSLLFAGLYLYLGLGLTMLVSPRELRRYGLLLAPLVGYCYMTLAGWYCFISGLRGTDTYATAVCLPPLGFLIVVVVRHVRNREDMRGLLNKDAGIALGLALIAFIAVSVPSILSPHGLTAMSLGNADVIHYSLAARYLKSFSMGADAGYLGQGPSITEGAHDRFGTVLATALPSSLFSLETYQLQNTLMHVFFAFGVLSMVYLVGREVFGYRPLAAALGSVLVAVNPLLYYTTYHLFEGQIVAMALTLGLVVLHVQTARAASVRSYLRYLPLTALMTWGLSVTYGHMLPPAYAALGAIVVTLAWQRRSYVVLSRWLGFCVATVLVTLACSPERGRLVVQQVLFFGGRTAGEGGALGWPVPWLLPSGLFTIPNAFPWPGPSTAAPVAWALGTAFMLLMVWAFSSSYRADRERFSLVAGCSVVVLAGYAAMAIADQSDTGGYASYKWLSFFLPLLLLCLVAPLATFEGTRLRPSWWVCLALIIAASTFYSAREVVAMMRTPWVVRPEMAALRAIEANPGVRSINILADSSDLWSSMWKSNFLMRKKLYHERRGAYFPAAALIGDWDLHSIDSIDPLGRSAGDDDGILQVRDEGSASRDVIHVNQSFTLTRARDLKVKYGPGWHGNEPTLRWTGNGSAVAQLLLDVRAERKAISLALTYWPWNPRNRLSVFLNDHFLADCPDDQACALARVELPRGRNILEFRSALPPERPANDSRELAYAFTKIEIHPIQ